MVGKILQDNRTEVGVGRKGLWGCSSPPTSTTEALNALSVPQEKLRLFLDKKCQYLPFQDWSVKCKRMVDTGILVLVQLGKQVLVTQGEPPGSGFSVLWDVLGACRCSWSLGQTF